jgi:hypothetical protein
LLLKVFFGEVASPEILAGHIRERRLEAERLRSHLEELDAEEPGDVYDSLTRRWGLEYAAAVIRWAKRAERELARSPS